MGRVISAEDIVIMDGMNYIKGFRYQMFCVAKNVPTPSCVVRSLDLPFQNQTYIIPSNTPPLPPT